MRLNQSLAADTLTHFPIFFTFLPLSCVYTVCVSVFSRCFLCLIIECILQRFGLAFKSFSGNFGVVLVVFADFGFRAMQEEAAAVGEDNQVVSVM
jgi:hypothetical protein